MTRENIQIADPNFTTDGVYFYSLSYTNQSMQAKTDDGDTAFSYPVDTALTGTVNALEWDGVYFWSLEDKATADGVIIRKWAIDSFLLKQITSFTLTDGGGHTYRADDFAVEYYCLSVGNNGLDGINPPFTYGLSSVEVSDNAVFSSGDTVNFVRRRAPTSQRYGTSLVESKVVTTVGGDGVTLNFGSSMSQGVYGDAGGFRGPAATFSASDPTPPDFVYVTKNIWLLNNNAPSGSATGGLYRLNPNNGSVVVAYSGAQYDDITSAGFYATYNVSGTFPWQYNTSVSGTEKFVLFAKGTNLLFFNVDTLAVTKSLSLDAVAKVAGGNWTISDLAVAGFEPNVALYRLQNGTTYGNPLSDESWSTVYSYEKTLLRRVVSSISITVTPAILPADGVSQSQVTAVVVDQYGAAVSGKSVVWAEDGAGSITGSNPATSDTFGRAYTVYTAGSSEEDVKITATVADGLV